MGRLRVRLPSLDLFQVWSLQGISGGPYAKIAQAGDLEIVVVSAIDR
jgi:hypothetical protein